MRPSGSTVIHAVGQRSIRPRRQTRRGGEFRIMILGQQPQPVARPFSGGLQGVARRYRADNLHPRLPEQLVTGRLPSSTFFVTHPGLGSPSADDGVLTLRDNGCSTHIAEKVRAPRAVRYIRTHAGTSQSLASCVPLRCTSKYSRNVWLCYSPVIDEHPPRAENAADQSACRRGAAPRRAPR